MYAILVLGTIVIPAVLFFDSFPLSLYSMPLSFLISSNLHDEEAILSVFSLSYDVFKFFTFVSQFGKLGKVYTLYTAKSQALFLHA